MEVKVLSVGDLSARVGGGEAEAVAADLHVRVGEADRRQATWQLRGVDGEEHVVRVDLAAGRGVRAVGADQEATWPQHAEQLAEQSVLHRDRRHVMQHGEGRDRGEAAAVERERGGVGLHDLDIGASEALSQRRRKLPVHLDRHQSWDPPAQGIGDQSGTGAHLENLVAEAAPLDHPWQQHALDQLGPFGARADL